ncbi:winged helix DNA-binding domain-containing protein [Streptomyces sp. SID3343]|uniref:winged helix DNA-binding domain-containing protein n=1 Tax=Streptomyces sp. SID3343 TaxID=2690260 RepID=UPI00136A0FC7|nr:winged helix DNA-binding domain-containing protein [Streptomyces sp. SID3343]MYW02719.1 winged helix DNA-binding domain-containing protein [Streptomyces sp. SID3343]
MEITTLGPRRLNRALLERQLLTRRHEVSAEAAISHLVGMQAQAPHPPYTGLWTRLVDFQPAELSELLTDRRVVRVGLMRGTVHLVTADDCVAIRPIVQPIYDASLYRNVVHGLGDSTVDVAEVVAAGRELMAERPLTAKVLGLALAERFPGEDPKALAHTLRSQAALVQVPPRALWGRSAQAACTTAEHWLGRPLAASVAPDAMLMRYLAAFGPATVADMQAWSGLTRLREAVERLRPALAVYRDEAGRELFDVPDAPLPAEDAPAPVRFLPEFDNLLLSHGDRTRIISDADRKRVFTINGIIRSTFLVDGFVAGLWRITRAGASSGGAGVGASRGDGSRGGGSTGGGSIGGGSIRGDSAVVLEIEPFRPVGEADRAALAEEGARLLAFNGADCREVRFV